MCHIDLFRRRTCRLAGTQWGLRNRIGMLYRPPFADSTVLLLDEHLRKVPIGQTYLVIVIQPVIVSL
jgi:hypothetical protein